MQAGCLTDRSWIPERMDHNASTTLPGERFSADQQCQSTYFNLYSASIYLVNHFLKQVCCDMVVIVGELRSAP